MKIRITRRGCTVYAYVALSSIHSYMIKSYIHPNLTISCSKHVFIPILLITLAIFAYYDGIMLNALATLLCSKLCWHNRLKPIRGEFHASTCFPSRDTTPQIIKIGISKDL